MFKSTIRKQNNEYVLYNYSSEWNYTKEELEEAEYELFRSESLAEVHAFHSLSSDGVLFELRD